MMIRTVLASLLVAVSLSAPPVARALEERDPATAVLPAGDLAVGTQALPPARETYDPGNLVWAKAGRLHDGGQVMDLSPWRIERMQRSPHGFFLRLSRSEGGEERLAWYDGHVLTWIGRSASMPEVSPDGRFAGWVDRGGPRIRYGRAGRVIVVDLVTGQVVFSTSRWMGKNADLYEEIYPVFLGFDAQYAYWSRVTGDITRVRTDLTTWQTSPAAALDEDGYEIPLGLPLDPYTGTAVSLQDGRPSGDGLGEPGFISADGRFAFNVSATARLTITDPTTGARVDPEWDNRWRWFVGWQDADTAYIALPRRFTYSYGPGDRTPVRVVACDLPLGSCTHGGAPARPVPPRPRTRPGVPLTARVARFRPLPVPDRQW